MKRFRRSCVAGALASTVLVIGCVATAHAQSTPKITGIAQVVFYADDLSKSRDFYEGRIGWVVESVPGKSDAKRFYANHLQYVQVEPPPIAGQPDRLAIHVARLGPALPVQVKAEHVSIEVIERRTMVYLVAGSR